MEEYLKEHFSMIELGLCIAGCTIAMCISISRALLKPNEHNSDASLLELITEFKKENAYSEYLSPWDFSIQYPSIMNELPSSSNDGTTLAFDANNYIEVYGAWTKVRRIKSLYKKDIESTAYRITHKSVKKESYELSGINSDGNYFNKKCALCGQNVVASANIIYEPDLKKEMKSIVKTIFDNFPIHHNDSFHYAGDFNGMYPFNMFLNLADDSGYEYYDAAGPDNTIELKISKKKVDDSNKLSLRITEYYKGKKCGTFDAQFEGVHVMRGTFTNAEGKEMQFEAVLCDDDDVQQLESID